MKILSRPYSVLEIMPIPHPLDIFFSTNLPLGLYQILPSWGNLNPLMSLVILYLPVGILEVFLPQRKSLNIRSISYIKDLGGVGRDSRT